MKMNLESRIYSYLDATCLSGKIDMVPNKDKYSPGDDIDSQASLQKVFSLMSELNKVAVDSDYLCNGGSGKSLKDTLLSSAQHLKRILGKQSIRYLEVGPEPYKTTAFIKELTNEGIRINKYLGLDINPNSKDTMRHFLSTINEIEQFEYLIADYNTTTTRTFGDFDGTTIITMFGFQEGNEMPDDFLYILGQITRPGDIVISEMQVLNQSGWSPIIDFYKLAPMVEFSKVTCQRNSLISDEAHKIFVVPVMSDPEPTFAVATVAPVRDGNKDRFLLTNSCIKYTPEQFKYFREKNGLFKVIAEFETGDKTVLYQTSIRQGSE